MMSLPRTIPLAPLTRCALMVALLLAIGSETRAQSPFGSSPPSRLLGEIDARFESRINFTPLAAPEIPFVDLPLPYHRSGPFVSMPATVVGGVFGAAVGALFVPVGIVVAILPTISLLDGILVPLEWGWWIGVHTVGRVVGAPLWIIKAIVWDFPTAVFL